MGKIETLKEELRQAILDSDEYKEYRRLEIEITKNADLRRTVDEFRRKNFEIQYNDDVQDVEGGIAWLEEQYADIRNQGIVKNFLAAEICLCRMVQDICTSIVDTIDFDTDFLQ